MTEQLEANGQKVIGGYTSDDHLVIKIDGLKHNPQDSPLFINRHQRLYYPPPSIRSMDQIVRLSPLTRHYGPKDKVWEMRHNEVHFRI